MLKKIKRFYVTLTIAIGISLLSACGPTLKKGSIENIEIKKVAILPIDIKAQITKEERVLLESLLISRLKERGYVVLDPAFVDNFCGAESRCPGQLEAISSKYLPDAVVDLSVDSSFSLNIIAGYYNTLGGDLRVISPNEGKLFYSVSHSESEKGGLVFNSGQVIQGLKESFASTGSPTFNRLAQKFTESLVFSLPRATTKIGEVRPSAPNFQYTITKTISPKYSKICLLANQKGKAEIVSKSRSISLRDVALEQKNVAFDNQYCSILALTNFYEDSETKILELKFTTSFGGSYYKDISENLISIAGGR